MNEIDIPAIIADQIKPRRCHECGTKVVPIEVEVQEQAKSTSGEWGSDQKKARTVYTKACPRCYYASKGQKVSVM